MTQATRGCGSTFPSSAIQPIAPLTPQSVAVGSSVPLFNPALCHHGALCHRGAGAGRARGDGRIAKHTTATSCRPRAGTVRRRASNHRGRPSQGARHVPLHLQARRRQVGTGSFEDDLRDRAGDRPPLRRVPGHRTAAPQPPARGPADFQHGNVRCCSRASSRCARAQLAALPLAGALRAQEDGPHVVGPACLTLERQPASDRGLPAGGWGSTSGAPTAQAWRGGARRRGDALLP